MFCSSLSEVLRLSKTKIVASFTNWNINNIFTVTRKWFLFAHVTVLPLASLNENNEQGIMYPALW